MAISPRHWQMLQECNTRLAETRIQALFAADPDRARRYSLEVDGLFVDYSRHAIDDPAWLVLAELAEAAGLDSARHAMAAGEVVNASENRAARHMALRGEEAAQNRSLMEPVVGALHRGQWAGASGQTIQTLVNIGIGGSDLGPRMVVDALAPFHQEGIRVEFLANIDGESMRRLLASLDPHRTAFCVTSKSFGTDETLTNARTVRRWLADQLSTEELTAHFVAVTGRPASAAEFGVAADRILPLADEVGGRYSLWSCAGLPIAAAVGMEHFADLLQGAAVMDAHFLDAPLARNLPVALALLGIWYRNVRHCNSYVTVPYDRRLQLFPAYLQQLDMESSGKRLDRQGETVDHPTGPISWGGEGTKGQHAFFQWLHQSTDFVPVDLIAAARPHHDHSDHHRKLLANLLGQATALMQGREAEQPHRSTPGNRPSTVLLLDNLAPRSLGTLLALYEHKVFSQAWIWGINPFDQFGVELGKELAGRYERALAGEEPGDLDPAARQLIERLRDRKDD